MAETVCSWTGMGTFRIVDSALVKRAVQCPLNAFGATQPPEGSRVGGLGSGLGRAPRLTRCSHLSNAAQLWLEGSVIICGWSMQSPRPWRGRATGAKPTSTWSQSVSLARGKLRQGASSIARHRQPLHLQRQLPRQANDRPTVYLAP